MENGIPITDTLDIANKFNSFFFLQILVPHLAKKNTVGCYYMDIGNILNIINMYKLCINTPQNSYNCNIFGTSISYKKGSITS